MNKCDCYISNKYQLISNESINHYTLDELMRLVNRLKVNRSFVYTVSNLAELNEIFKYYPTKAQTVEILGGATGIVPVAQNLTDDSIDYAWTDYYTKEEVIAFINAGFIPELPAKTYVFTVNPTPATATVIINGVQRNSVVVYEGEQVVWSVGEESYKTQMGVQNVTENTTIDVSLIETPSEDEPSLPIYTVCIQPVPSDSYVFLDGVNQSCISLAEGKSVRYTVQRSGYISQTGTIVADGNKTIAIVLEEKPVVEPNYYTLTINPVPSTATVVIDGVEQTSITVVEGTTVSYEVYADGYYPNSGSLAMNEDKTLEVVLEENPYYNPTYTLTINPVPSTATVTINGMVRRIFEGTEGTVANWSVSADGYVTQSGSYTIGTANYEMSVTLEEYVPQNYTFTINPVPTDATVTINGVERTSITVVEGTTVSYTVEKQGYHTRSENLVINSNTTLNVILEENIGLSFTITTNVDGAEIIINDLVTDTYYADSGTVINWSVSADGYVTKSGSFTLENNTSMHVILISVDCNPQTVNTLTEYKKAGSGTGIIDLCTYDLTPYTGELYSDSDADNRSYVNYYVKYFEGDLTSNGRTDLSYAFSGRPAIKTVAYVGDTSNVTSMSNMFCGTSLSTLTGLENWNTGNVTNMSYMFKETSSLSDLTPLANWNTGSVTDMEGMFYGAEFYTSRSDLTPLENWDTGNVKNMSYMFYDTPYSTLTGLENWDTGNVKNMSYMFDNCNCLSDISALSGWNTSNVTNMSNMFRLNPSLSDISALSGWDVSSVEDMEGMFESCNPLTDISALSNWDVSKVKYMNAMFYRCNSLSDISALSNWNTSNVEDMRGVFYECYPLSDISALSGWDVSKVKYMNAMFYLCQPLTSLTSLENWNTSNVEDMRSMFYGTYLSDLTPISNWDTGNVKNMRYMFAYCTLLTTADLSNWDISNVTDMSYMFDTCYSLTEVRFGGDCNPSADYGYMFYDVSSTGTLYYPAEYADNYANIINEIPSKWTAVAY